jgi:alpha-tubulin suppressor-like RCC1 family protein
MIRVRRGLALELRAARHHSRLTAFRSPQGHIWRSLRFAQVSVGGVHACGKIKSGATYCWGHNRFGNLGDGTTDDRYVPTPVIGGL